MDKESKEELNASIAHIILCFVSGQNLGQWMGSSYADSGLHANFFMHGVLGFLQSHGQSEGQLQSYAVGFKQCDWNIGSPLQDFSYLYGISHKATRYLALPCVLADLSSEKKELCAIHLISGLLPFALSLAGEENRNLGNLVIALSIVSLCNYAMNKNCTWGWYTAGASALSYFCSLQTVCQGITYPSSLALVDYCASKLLAFHQSQPDNTSGSGGGRRSK